MKFFLGSVFFFLLGIQSMVAQLSLADIFTDNMVLQRDEPIHFWGNGIPDTSLEVLFESEVQKTRIRKDSTWRILFKKREANSVPESVQITSGKETIKLTNVLVGDVWLCIGQSNMEFPMQNEMHLEEEQIKADRPLLRFYNATFAGKGIYNQMFTDSVLRLLNKKDFYKGKWASSDRTSIKQMSAVGYYFGKQILESEHIPIGLINLAIGGSPIETFIGRDAMENNSHFLQKVRENWLVNEALPVWIRERGQQNVGDAAVIYRDDLGPNHAFKPGFAYSAGIEPLFQMPIKGILWYQGESNAQEPQRVTEYGELQKLLVQEYRQQWKQPELPFYWVQLSSIDTAKYKSGYWPEFRNEQRKLLEAIPNGGMAVTSDIGAKNDVHPTNKRAVGNRLARWALNKTYGEQIVPSGPLPTGAVFKNGKVVIDFKYAAKGLKMSDNKKIKGFSIDGKHEVTAVLKGNTVEIPAQGKPEFVYYGWQPYSNGNLVNSEGLPASTFKIQL